MSLSSLFQELGTLAYSSLILPLEWLMGHIFSLSYSLTGSPGWSILLLSAVVNTILLPLYFIGDKIQHKEQATQARLQPKLDEFGRAFQGSTLHMVKNTFYRQQGYHPIYALRSSIGFAIQVPFFIAAYHYLSHLELLQKISWGAIADLAQPDTLIHIPQSFAAQSLLLGSRINLLPLLMTAFNLLSSLAYILQDQKDGQSKPTGSQKQLWFIALLFLVLLYNSPAALLLYWTFSNLYSLFKNLIQASLKQGLPYWKRLWSSSVRAAKATALWLKSLPYIQFFETALVLIGLSLLARFKLLDSLENKAQEAWFWGSLCWYSFAFLQIAQISFRVLRKFGLKAVLKCHKDTRNALILIGCHALLILAAYYFVRISAVKASLNTVEPYLVSIIFLGFSLLLAILPRLWRSRVYQNLARQKQELLLLSSACCTALLGLLLFNSSSLLFSSPSESPQAIAVFLQQVLPGFCIALVLCFLPLFLTGQRKILKRLRSLQKSSPHSKNAKSSKSFKNSQNSQNSKAFKISPLQKQGAGQIHKQIKLGTVVAFLSSGVLILSLSSAFLLKHDYGVMTSWVFDQPEKLFISLGTILVTVAFMPILYALWLFLVKKMTLLISLCWIVGASLWLASGYYSYSLIQYSKDKASESISISESTGEPNESDTGPNAGQGSIYSYSREQNNVIIMMLDRFIGPYFKDILELEPALKTELEGFTWYENTLSPGPFTISGLTAVLGGHEYSPKEIAELPGSLREKVNQAYLMLPLLFQHNGYQVTVSDPSWANFDWRGDLNLFRERGIRAERLKGRYTGQWLQRINEASEAGPQLEAAPQNAEQALQAEPNYAWLLLMQSIFRSTPSPIAPLIYYDGSWLGSNFSSQSLFTDLIKTWSTLVALPEISDSRATSPTFTFMTNDTPHEPMAMGYVGGIAQEQGQKQAEAKRYPFQPVMQTEPGEQGPLPPELLEKLENDYSLRHFYADWATMREVSRYLSWMKEQGVYDNSLIILVSDHGRDVELPHVDLGPDETEYAYFMPLLMVKPLQSSGPLQINREAHSSADVPTFASQALPAEQRKNLATGKQLRFQEGPRRSYYISQNPSDQYSDRFRIRHSYIIQGPIFQEKSWQTLY